MQKIAGQGFCMHTYTEGKVTGVHRERERLRGQAGGRDSVVYACIQVLQSAK